MAYALTDEEMAKIPDGYERLLHDVFVNDSTNFTHWSELERYWQFIDQIENYWEKENQKISEIIQYPPYRMGPKEANQIFESPTEHWIYG